MLQAIKSDHLLGYQNQSISYLFKPISPFTLKDRSMGDPTLKIIIKPIVIVVQAKKILLSLTVMV